MTNVSHRLDLPVGSIGRHFNGWWGVMMRVVTEGALFVYLTPSEALDVAAYLETIR